jgi:hypothetical protein
VIGAAIAVTMLILIVLYFRLPKQTPPSTPLVRFQSPPAHPSPKNKNIAVPTTKTERVHGPSNTEKREAAKQIFDRFLDPEVPFRIDTCKSLHSVRDESDRSRESLIREAVLLTQEKKSGDPYLETLAGPLPIILRRPEVRDLLQTVSTALRENRREVISSWDYRAKSTKAALAVWKDRNEINARLDTSYLLFMLVRSMREAPVLIDNPSARDLCEEIQNSLNSYEPIGDRDDLRRRLEEIIAHSGVTHEKIGYRSEYRGGLQLVRGPKGPLLEVPWMMDIWNFRE